MLLWSRPRRRFGDFAAAGKVTRRPQAAKLPLQETKPLCHRPLIRLAFGQPPSPQGEGLRFCIGGPLGAPAVNGQSIVGSSKPGAGVEPHSS